MGVCGDGRRSEDICEKVRTRAGLCLDKTIGRNTIREPLCLSFTNENTSKPRKKQKGNGGQVSHSEIF